MKTIFVSTWSLCKHLTDCLVKAFILTCALSAVADVHGGPTRTYSFFAIATGPFAITPLSPTIVQIDQKLSFASALPFPLTTGFVKGFDDITLPFPDRFFDGTFVWSGRGQDAVFGTATVQTSVFTDPVNPSSGDFFGSEDFTGTFQFTGGTGRYLNATGGGTYTAHSEYRPPGDPGVLLSGFTTIILTGVVTVGPPTPRPFQLKTLDVPGHPPLKPLPLKTQFPFSQIAADQCMDQR